MNKSKFLKDAFEWAIDENNMDINSDTFVHDLFMIISPMSNFEISIDDISAYREALKEQQ